MRVSRYALVFACGLAAGYGVHVWQTRLANPDTPARCIRVIDGDTLEVIWKGETNAVRLVGVEAPEIRRGQKLTAFAERFKMQEDKARKAGQDIRAYLEGVALGEEVVLEFPGERADSFGRWLAYVDCGGLDVGAELLDRGYAVTRSEKHPRSPRYLEIAERAERENRGLWAWAAR